MNNSLECIVLFRGGLQTVKDKFFSEGEGGGEGGKGVVGGVKSRELPTEEEIKGYLSQSKDRQYRLVFILFYFILFFEL